MWSKNKFVVLMIAFVLSLVFTACGGKQKEAASSKYEDLSPSGQKVVFWHQHSRARGDLLNQLVNEFNSSNKYSIKVEAKYFAGIGKIQAALTPILGTSAAPNLVVAYQTQAATYAKSKGLIDIDLLMKNSKWGLTASEKANYFDSVFTHDIYPRQNNKRYGFPINHSLEVLYYNQDWLKELGFSSAPKTFEEFEAMTCAAKNKPFSKFNGQGSIGYEISIDASRFASWTFAFGGDIFDYNTNKYSLNSQNAKEAMLFLQKLINKGCIKVVTERFGDQSDFGAGKTLFTLSSTTGLPYYKTAVDNTFSWSVSSLPNKGTKPAINSYGASISLPSGHSKEQDIAAWLFLKYLTTADAQAKWAKASNYMPVRKDTKAKMGNYFLSNPQYEQAFDLITYAKSEPAVEGYDVVRALVSKAMDDIARGGDVKNILDTLNTKANSK